MPTAWITRRTGLQDMEWNCSLQLRDDVLHIWPDEHILCMCSSALYTVHMYSVSKGAVCAIYLSYKSFRWIRINWSNYHFCMLCLFWMQHFICNDKNSSWIVTSSEFQLIYCIPFADAVAGQYFFESWHCIRKTKFSVNVALCRNIKYDLKREVAQKCNIKCYRLIVQSDTDGDQDIIGCISCSVTCNEPCEITGVA